VRRLIACGGAIAAGLVLFLPGVPLMLHTMQYDRMRNEDRAAPPPLHRLVPDVVADWSVGQRALGFDRPARRRAVLAGAAVVFPALLAVGIATLWRRHREATRLFLLYTILPPATYLLLGRRLVAVRFFLPFMLTYAALVGAGLAALGRRSRAWLGAALVVLCAVPLAHFVTRFEWSYDHARVAGALATRLRPGDAIAFVHPYEAFYYRWYLGEGVPMHGLVFTALDDQGVYVMMPPRLTLDVARRRVLDLSASYTRLWLVGQSQRSFASDPAEERKLLGWMRDRFGAPVENLDPLTGGDPAIAAFRTAGRGTP
jgi:hypothetical protein